MSYYFTLIYPKNQKTTTVSDLLRELLIPRKWRHYLRINHEIKINGKYHYFNQLVYPNDRISIKLNFVETHQHVYPASGQMPDVIYENNDLLVINKPSGQKTHPNLHETDTALNDCTTYLGKSPFVVHRLDMLTSGLLLVAKNPAVVPILNKELTNKTFHRDYLAKVGNGQKLENEGVINLPIGRDPSDKRKRMVVKDGLKSITHYQVLHRNQNGTAIIKLILKTGRTHQIRVHLSASGCPIVGDPLYNQNFKKGEKLALIAYKMSFIKPFTFQQVEVKLPKEKIRV